MNTEQVVRNIIEGNGIDITIEEYIKLLINENARNRSLLRKSYRAFVVMPKAKTSTIDHGNTHRLAMKIRSSLNHSLG